MCLHMDLWYETKPPRWINHEHTAAFFCWRELKLDMPCIIHKHYVFWGLYTVEKLSVQHTSGGIHWKQGVLALHIWTQPSSSVMLPNKLNMHTHTCLCVLMETQIVCKDMFAGNTVSPRLAQMSSWTPQFLPPPERNRQRWTFRVRG